MLENHLKSVMLACTGKLLQSTHLPVFRSFCRLFASYCIGQISIWVNAYVFSSNTSHI